MDDLREGLWVEGKEGLDLGEGPGLETWWEGHGSERGGGLGWVGGFMVAR